MARPSIASLPDDVLVCIMGGLTLQERHASAAPVCRRWRRLANSTPHLLRVVKADFGGGNERAGARLTSFCVWVLSHAAQHMQRLSLNVEPALDHAPAGTSERLSAALATALVGCGMAGGLTSLRITASTELSLIWMYGLRRLQRLVLIATDNRPICWDAPSSALPALEDLALVGSPITLPPHARLPPSLTKLYLESIETDTLPPQLAALTRLHTLSLRSASCTGAGYDTLTRLPSLRRLVLRDCHDWPSCLSQLTGLEALSLDGGGELQDVAALEALRQALPRLTRLTWLALDAPAGIPAPPPELASLTCLRSFFLMGASGPLPTGPWLSSLQRLATYEDTIVASAAALAAAPQLNFLGMLYCGQKSQLSLSLGAALRAPALQRLVCRASKEALVCNLQALLRAQLQNPSVLLDFEVYRDYDEFWACCGYDANAATSRDAFLAGNA